MTTTSKTRFTRVLCMAFTLAVAAALPSVSAQTYGPELLINGGFEAGPLKAYNYTGPEGWNRLMDPTYWNLLTNIDPAPAGSTLNAGSVYSGHYSVRRNIVTNTPAGNVGRLNSVVYNLGSFSDDVLTTGDTLLFSLDARRTGGGTGTVNLWGEIIFYDAGSTEILTASTAMIGTGVLDWVTLTIEVVVPDNAAFFMVSGVNQVEVAPSQYAYVTYDNFSLKTVTPVPEPATVSAMLALVAGASVVAYRRKRHKA